MKNNNKRLVAMWNNVMNYIGCEYLTIGTNLSELEDKKQYYNVENGITIEWMLHEAEYWLSCYYEEGNVRCDDKEYDYATWKAETKELKRLITRLKKEEKEKDFLIVEW